MGSLIGAISSQRVTQLPSALATVLEQFGYMLEHPRILGYEAR